VLTRLTLSDPRVHRLVSALLGADPVFVGSEYNRAGVATGASVIESPCPL
jgi:hypothetical protein